LLLPVVSIEAQEQPPPLQPGERVRVSPPDLGIEKQAATFDGLESVVLVVTADTKVRCPLASVTRLETYAGRHSHPWRGAGIGFLAGWALGFGVWHAADIGCFEYTSESVCAAWFGGGLGAASGALLGALVGGLLWQTDRWQEIPLDKLRLQIASQPGGRFGFGASIRF
jgi:hypothetical protein